ncbi:hypothetical protein LAD73_01720 [Mycoplasma sp. 1331]|uniref:Uncharacterized protein n=1 Tax=Mycoplasma tauri TaxID=547987 RepID=A0A953T794_9MOLU|nr:hypothetical protein [Mycoplasma tauri]MBZ4195437.1 hypothetical protein [Mycoplasma tauri]
MSNKLTFEPKEELFLCSDSLLIKSDRKNPISDFSISFLFELIYKTIIKDDASFLISYQGDEKHYNIVESLWNIDVLNRKNLFKYDSHCSTDISLDILAAKKYNIDYVVKLKIGRKCDFIYFYVYDLKNNYYISEQEYREVYKSFFINPTKAKINNDIHADETKIISLDNLVTLQASNSEILKAFSNVKQRYRSKNMILTNDLYSLTLVENLFKNYDSSFKIKSNTIKNKINNFFYKLFHSNVSNLRPYQSIINIDSFTNLDISLNLNYKLKKVTLNTAVLIYLDFLIDEIKRSKFIDVSNLFVVIPQNATFQIIELLDQYNIKYVYYDPTAIYKYLWDENCLFAYTLDSVNANPRYSKINNNFYFLICLVWMLNSYTNRNNLLSFKYNLLCENFGKVKSIIKEYKFDSGNVHKIKSIIEQNAKNKIFDKYEIFDIFISEKFVIAKFLMSDKKHQTIMWYDYKNSKICIEYQICFELNKNMRAWKFDYIRSKFFIKKLLKKAKN